MTPDSPAHDDLLRGLWRENPVLVNLLGLCPVLAVTNSVENALGMGAATLFVLCGSSVLVSMLRHLIPAQVRISAYILIIATFVSVADMSLAALAPVVHKGLGAFIALIVVNCMILGRQEAFASKNRVPRALLDATGTGLGFAFALLAMGGVRELLGAGTLLGLPVFGPGFEPWVIMLLPAGGFLTLGVLLLAVAAWTRRGERAAAAELATAPDVVAVREGAA
ncbi:MAG: electron transport complex subunit RsxE [Planctomycetota bacterium]|jgi:electron transport complex protein RnfE